MPHELKQSSLRRSIWLRNNRLKMIYERRVRSGSNAIFKSEAQRVLLAVRNATTFAEATSAATRAIDESAPLWGKMFKTHLTAAMFGFGRLQFRDLKHDAAEREEKQTEFRFLDFVRNWIDLQAGAKINAIEGTTKTRLTRRLRIVINDALVSGEGTPKIAQAVKDTYIGFSKPRSLTIARTEVGFASEAANKESAKLTGLDLRKEWITAGDGRERDSHKVTDKQVRGMDEPFDVDGTPMNHPLDPDAPPKEVINCRCTQRFIPKGR